MLHTTNQRTYTTDLVALLLRRAICLFVQCGNTEAVRKQSFKNSDTM